VQLAYPDTKTILGDLDDTDLIKEQSKAADVVLSMSGPTMVRTRTELNRLCYDRARSKRKSHLRRPPSKTRRDTEARLLDPDLRSDRLRS
jgi:hypothetical protein